MLTILIGTLASVLALVINARKKLAAKFAKPAIWLAIVGGFTVAGWLGTALDAVGRLMAALSGNTTALLFGAAAPAVVALILFAELYLVLIAGAKPRRWLHTVVGFIAPAALVVSVGFIATVVGAATDGINEGVPAVVRDMQTAG